MDAYDVYKKFDLVKTLPKMEDVMQKDIYDEADLDDFEEFIQSKIEKDFPLGMTYEEFAEKANEIDA